MSADSQDVLTRIDGEKERYLEELKEYLRIPSVSTDPEHREDVLRCSEFVVEQLRKAGLSAEAIETAGNPLVYAEWLGAEGESRRCCSTATTMCSRPIRSRSGTARRSNRR